MMFCRWKEERITMDQCRESRDNADAFSPCSDCTDWMYALEEPAPGPTAAQASPVPDLNPEPDKEETMAKKKECAHCKRIMTMAAFGLCGTCYGKFRKGNPEVVKTVEARKQAQEAAWAEQAAQDQAAAAPDEPDEPDPDHGQDPGQDHGQDPGHQDPPGDEQPPPSPELTESSTSETKDPDMDPDPEPEPSPAAPEEDPAQAPGDQDQAAAAPAQEDLGQAWESVPDPESEPPTETAPVKAAPREPRRIIHIHLQGADEVALYEQLEAQARANCRQTNQEAKFIIKQDLEKRAKINGTPALRQY